MNPYTYESIVGDHLLDVAADLYKTLPGSRNFPRKDISSWKQLCLNGNFRHFTETYQSLLVTLKFNELDPDNKIHAALLANLGRFNALLTDFESSIRRGGDRVDWRKVWKGLVWYMNSYANTAYEEQPAEDLRSIDALQIMTIHQAKGLEWPIVFIPCMTSKRFPSSRSGQGSNWHISKDLFDYERYRGGEEDERKLFYVGVTRARDICCLSNHLRIQNSISRSHFLNCLGKGIITKTEKESFPKIVIKKSGEQEEIQTFSGGEIIGYRRCPYFYRLREQWNYQAGLDPALGYGKSLHHCLRVASERIKVGAEPEDAVSKAIDAEFHLPYAPAKAKETMAEAARKRLKQFVKQHADDMKNIEEVEARLEFPVEKATITGRVDVILKGKEKPVYEVRDYKTSEDVTTFEESSLQVRLYTLGLRKMGRPTEKASIAYLETGEVKAVEISDKHLEEAKKTAEECIKSITSSKYKAKPKAKCNCDYERICCYCKKT
jgi:DNA helicase-2/ATP-dependent DNA helicase PcrA